MHDLDPGRACKQIVPPVLSSGLVHWQNGWNFRILENNTTECRPITLESDKFRHSVIPKRIFDPKIYRFSSLFRSFFIFKLCFFANLLEIIMANWIQK